MAKKYKKRPGLDMKYVLSHYLDQIARTKHHLSQQPHLPPPPPDPQLDTNVEFEPFNFKPTESQSGEYVNGHESAKVLTDGEATSFIWKSRSKNGKSYTEKRKVALEKETVTMHPRDCMAIRQLPPEAAKRVLQNLCENIVKLWRQTNPDIEPLLVNAHPNEGVIHFHLWHRGCTDDHQSYRTPRNGKVGRPSGISLCPSEKAHLRIARSGFQTDKVSLQRAQEQLKRVRAQPGRRDFEFDCEELLDTVIGAMFAATKNQHAQTAYKQATEAYSQHRQARVEASEAAIKARLAQANATVDELKSKVEFLSGLLDTVNLDRIAKQTKPSQTKRPSQGPYEL